MKRIGLSILDEEGRFCNFGLYIILVIFDTLTNEILEASINDLHTKTIFEFMFS